MLSQLCEIYVERIYERHYQPRLGDVVLDVGANMGMFTTRVAKMIGESGLVIAVEPDRRNVELLKRNIEANRLSNVVIVPKGAWNSKGAMKLNLFSGSTGLSSFYNNFFKALGRLLDVVEVKVDALDGILYDLDVSHADFVKMDIEGAEVEALKGIESIARYESVRMAIAAYHIVDGKVTCKWVMKKLRSLGLEVVREGAMVYGKRP
jgi:FkbM family methyltransferase